MNAEDQRSATSPAHHGHDWPGSRHLQDCDGVPSGSLAELVPRGMAQEILSRQSLRLLDGSRFVGQLAQRYLTRRMAGPGIVATKDPLAAFFWHKEIEALLNDIVENGTAQACSRGRFPRRRHGPCWACFSPWSAGTTRTARRSAQLADLQRPYRPQHRQSSQARRECSGRRYEPRRSSRPGSVSALSRGCLPGSGHVSHRQVGSRPLSRSPCLRRAGGTRTRDLVHPKHAR